MLISLYMQSIYAEFLFENNLFYHVTLARLHKFLGAKPSLETTYFTDSLTHRQKVSLLIFLFIFLIYILRNARNAKFFIYDL